MLIEFVVIVISLVICLGLILASLWSLALERITRGQGWQVRSGWTFLMTFAFDFLIGLIGGIFIAAFLYTVYGFWLDTAIVDGFPILLWMFGLTLWYYMPERVTEEEERAFFAEMAAKGEKPMIAPSWDTTPLVPLSTAFRNTFLTMSGLAFLHKRGRA